MAIIRWTDGNQYIGDPVRLLDDGVTWEFKMRQHGPRWAAGMVIHVKQPDIIEMAAAEIPMVRDAEQAAAEQPESGYLVVQDGLGFEFPTAAEAFAALDADMARGRETLPTVQDLLAAARKDGTVVNPKPEEQNG